MSLYYDVAKIEAEKRIDKINNYLKSLDEENFYKIKELIDNLDYFVTNYIEV